MLLRNSRRCGRRRWAGVCVAAALAASTAAGCGHRAPAPPDVTTTPPYQRAAGSLAVAQLAIEHDSPWSTEQAIGRLHEALNAFPDEPALWADLALLNLPSNPKNAASLIRRAAELAPNSADLESAYGCVERQRTNSAAALPHYRRAVALAPQESRYRWELVKALEDANPTGSAPEVASQLDEVVRLAPGNVAALVERAAAAARLGDRPTVLRCANRLAAVSSSWSTGPREQLAALRAAGRTPRAPLLGQAIVLRNVLMVEPAYRRDRDALVGAGPTFQGSGAEVAPIRQFVRLPPAVPAASAPDTGLTWAGQPLAAPPGAYETVKIVELQPDLPEQIAGQFPHGTSGTLRPHPEGPDSLIITRGSSLTISTSGKTVTLPRAVPIAHDAAGATSGQDSIAVMTLRYDFTQDLVLAGPNGVRFLRRTAAGGFTDVTQNSRLPAEVLQGPYTAVWPVDIDTDGDMDVMLGSDTGSPTVLHNNGDGMWRAIHPFPGIRGVRALVWADLDGDGTTDVGLLDGRGELAVFGNEHYGRYRRWPVPAGLGRLMAVSAADTTLTGALDLVALKPHGAIVRIARRSRPFVGPQWQIAEIARWANPPTDGTARLLWADLDNNGAVDLVATGSRGTAVWLADAHGALAATPTPLPIRAASLAPPNTEGRVDLVGLDGAGRPIRLVNHGSRPYRWVDLRPRAQFMVRTPPGEQSSDYRYNTFAVGSRITLYGGLLRVAQPVQASTVHFGIGDLSAPDAALMTMPTGLPSLHMGTGYNDELIPNCATLISTYLGG